MGIMEIAAEMTVLQKCKLFKGVDVGTKIVVLCLT